MTATTWNPSDKGAGVTLGGGNLQATCTILDSVRSTTSKSSGKACVRVTVNNVNAPGLIGLMNATANIGPTGNGYPGADANGLGYFSSDGHKYINGDQGAFGASYTTSDVNDFLFDFDAKTCQVKKNGVSQGTISFSFSGPYFFAVGSGSSGSSTFIVTADFNTSAGVADGFPAWDAITSAKFTPI